MNGSFKLLNFQASADSLEAELVFPAGGVWFAGHFPGFPVLPGVAQLFFTRHLARKAFSDFPDAGLYRKIKFRRLVRPDEHVQLKVERKGAGMFSFEMSVGGAVASCGVVEGGLEAEGRQEPKASTDRLADLPTINRQTSAAQRVLDGLLPHRPPMTMLAEAVSIGEGVCEAVADTSGDSVFYDPEMGGVPACAALEYMAQTMALVVGEARRRKGEAPKVGFVLGTRRLHVGVPVFESGKRYVTAAKCVYADDEFGSFDCSISGSEGEVAAASLTAYQPSDEMLAEGMMTLKVKSPKV